MHDMKDKQFVSFGGKGNGEQHTEKLFWSPKVTSIEQYSSS